MEAANIPLDYWSEEASFNARTLPYIIAMAGITCASLPIISPSSKTHWTSLKQLHWRPAVGLLVLMSNYGAMLAPLGFIFATSIFLVAAFRMLGIHQWWASCLVSVALTLAFWGLMSLLGIYLAPGDMISAMGWAT